MATFWNLSRVFLAVMMSGALPAWSQQDRNLEVRRAEAGERRVALVIGQSAYKTAPLRNPVNDARAIAQALRTAGFEVTLKEDLNQRGLFEAAREFGAKLREDGVALFYYAGHGMQVRDRNYLIPVEADIQSELEVPYTSLDVNFVMDLMGRARSRMNLVILDACRNNPFARSFRSAAQGLAQMEAPGGTLIAYATAPGKVASDGAGDNGLYTQYLLKHLPTPGLPVEIVFKRVREDVERETRSQQVPWESSSVKGDFFFVPPKPAAVLASVKPAPVVVPPAIDAALQTELAFWDAIKASSNASDYEAYLTAYPNGRFAPLARARVSTLQQQAAMQGDARDLAFWDSIKLSTNPAEYEAYLAQFPKGQFASLARARAQALRQPVAAVAPAPLAAPPKPAAAAAPVVPTPAPAPVQLASAAPSSAAIAAASGRPAVGERWVYQHIDLWKPAVKNRVTVAVTAADHAGITERASARIGARNIESEALHKPDLALSALPLGESTLLELSPFARNLELLKPGESFVLREMPLTGGAAIGQWGIRGTVHGEEEVSTPIGKFRAWRVEVLGDSTQTVIGSSVRRFSLTLWYAPEFKRYVRLAYESFAYLDRARLAPFNRDVLELVEVPR